MPHRRGGLLDDQGGVVRLDLVDVAAAESPLQANLAMMGIAGTLSLGGIATEVLDLGDASITSLPNAYV